MPLRRAAGGGYGGADGARDRRPWPDRLPGQQRRGAGAIDGVATLAPERFDETVSTVLRSVYLGMHFALPGLRRSAGGSIVNLGSTSALVAAPVLQAYGAAKAAVAMLTRNAALELAPLGIRVNCLCPGGIATAMYGIAAGLDPEAAEAARDEIAANLAALQPLGRAGRPEEVASAALFLASEGQATSPARSSPSTAG
ncbi:SDR family NAD(P)-dependent oxidoreductase [Rhizorhabdus histidinilytica]